MSLYGCKRRCAPHRLDESAKIRVLVLLVREHISFLVIVGQTGNCTNIDGIFKVFHMFIYLRKDIVNALIVFIYLCTSLSASRW
jgi:hypothetical protein